MALNDGVWFAEPDHPVCEKCTSSLDREETCNRCGGDGFVDTDDWDDDEDRDCIRCPECCGEPCGWFCSTCGRRWRFGDIKCGEDEA
jgi:hypothetical protein